MAFTPTTVPTPYAPSPSPVLPGSEKLYIDRELKAISEAISRLTAAVIELQEWADTV